MLSLIIGGSGSGKSDYSEKRCQELSCGFSMLYIATMQIFGEEGRRKVEQHRERRAGKSFVTVECPRDLEKIDVRELSGKVGADTALLECMSNLLANEMFREESVGSKEEVCKKILSGVEGLIRNLDNVVIVSNNVFEGGQNYGAETIAYMETLGELNRRIAKIADEVVEIEAGIPVYWKGKRCV